MTRFSINKLAVETGVDRRTLGKWLVDATPGKGGYTLADLVAGFRGTRKGQTLETERLRKTTAEADAVELANAEKRGELLDANRITRKFAAALIEMKGAIENNPKLTESDAHDLLLGLSMIIEDLRTEPDKPKRKAKK